MLSVGCRFGSEPVQKGFFNFVVSPCAWACLQHSSTEQIYDDMTFENGVWAAQWNARVNQEEKVSQRARGL
eukprot:3722062-Pleurochrysis_carterae.AAC.2